MPADDVHTTLPLPDFAKPVKLLIVVAPWHKAVTDALILGAKAKAALVAAEVEVLEVPGPLEVPAAIALAERLADFDGYVALGCVLRGQTLQYDSVSHETGRALMMMNLGGACIGHGLLTAETLEQAVERANPSGPDKGGEAAAAALHLIAISRKWAGKTKGIGFRA